jgi:YHS domain-containing protein
MTKDPVCGMQVDERGASATSVYNGAFYAFCGEHCKDKFDVNPERYAEAAVQSSAPRLEREPQGTS